MWALELVVFLMLTTLVIWITLPNHRLLGWLFLLLLFMVATGALVIIFY